MSNWKIGRPVVDAQGLKHVSVTTHDADETECMLLCLGGWVRVMSHCALEFTDGMVTCIVCTMFVVHKGRISLWIPSSAS